MVETIFFIQLNRMHLKKNQPLFLFKSLTLIIKIIKDQIKADSLIAIFGNFSSWKKSKTKNEIFCWFFIEF